MDKEIYAVATLQVDRIRKYPVSSERDLKKKGPGTKKEFVNSSYKLVVFS